MDLSVSNVSATAAWLAWSPAWRCPPGWAPLAVSRPNGDRPASGSSPRQPQREERAPPGGRGVELRGLAPLTGYVACVSCAPPLPHERGQQQHRTPPPGDQRGACVAFRTSGPDPGNRKKEMAIAIWVSSSVLLLLIAAFLVYGCLHIWCRRRRPLGKGAAAAAAAAAKQQQCHHQQPQQPVREEQQTLQCNRQEPRQEPRDRPHRPEDDADENRGDARRLVERAEEPGDRAATPRPDGRGRAGDAGEAAGGRGTPAE